MIKLKAYAFFLTIFIVIGVVVYVSFNAWENSQKQDAPVPSAQSSTVESTSKNEPASKGEKGSLEGLASRGEKVSLEEGLLKIEQANAQMKEQAEKLDINPIIEHLQKGELLEVIRHLRGFGRVKQTEPLPKGVQIEQTKQAEKDNTGAVQAEIDRLKAAEEERLRKKETAKRTE